MANEIISYVEMCRREGASLQRGMNFRLHPTHSVILMSVRRNAPYRDRIEDEGRTLIYEGHDQPVSESARDPKAVDQLAATSTGQRTQNGKFLDAVQAHRDGAQPEFVRVYEKIHQGIWAYNGLFALMDAWQQSDGRRKVFKFKLVTVEEPRGALDLAELPLSRGRLIPTAVKLEVWRRDRGRCVKCGAQDELHFDHILPYSRGGTSITADNVQLLCARHNLEKSNHIE
jgi:hypothetical protein